MPFLKYHSTKQSVKNRAHSIGLHPPTLKPPGKAHHWGSQEPGLGKVEAAGKPDGSKWSIPRPQGPEFRREPMACEYEGMPLFLGPEDARSSQYKSVTSLGSWPRPDLLPQAP